jgi:hypothetical protein
MPGIIDSSWTAEDAGSGPSADVLAGVLGALSGERDEHPAAALTNTQPTAIATRTGSVVTIDMRSSLRRWTDSQSDRRVSAYDVSPPVNAFEAVDSRCP